MPKIIYSALSNARAMEELEKNGFTAAQVRVLTEAHFNRVKDSPTNFEYFPRKAKVDLVSAEAAVAKAESSTRTVVRGNEKTYQVTVNVNSANQKKKENWVTVIGRGESKTMPRQNYAAKLRKIKNIYGFIVRKSRYSLTNPLQVMALDENSIDALNRKLRLAMPNQSEVEVNAKLLKIIKQAQTDKPKKVYRRRSYFIKDISKETTIFVTSKTKVPLR